MLPWGTPASRGKILEIMLLTLIAPVLFFRKLDSHLTILSGSLESCSIFRRPSNHTVSKAFSASIKRLMVRPPPRLLNHVETCSASLKSWWRQDFLVLNPAWKWFRRFWWIMYLVILETITLSINFPSVGSKLMGLYELGRVALFPGFRIIEMTALFQLSGKYPSSKEAL